MDNGHVKLTLFWKTNSLWVPNFNLKIVGLPNEHSWYGEEDISDILLSNIIWIFLKLINMD